MKSFLLSIFFLVCVCSAKAQTVDSIFFHLYTDSLKKGTYNYINVDGRLNNGRWLPLTAKEIIFTASAGKFDGNSLFIAPDFEGEKITVKAVLRANAAMFKESSIYIKKAADTARLKTSEEVMRPLRKGNRH
ncbi:MAG: hypothetical protein ABIU63_14205 [Chitinophagaceae bacterium]